MEFDNKKVLENFKKHITLKKAKFSLITTIILLLIAIIILFITFRPYYVKKTLQEIQNEGVQETQTNRTENKKQTKFA